jgi:NAD(P)-dependent dehydrogenase (short-subunit alcohol dehydrogenase family)
MRDIMGLNSNAAGLAVLVTGTSSGIGRATALHLDRMGYRVFAGIRRDSDAQGLRAAASTALTPLLLDVTRAEEVEAAMATVTAACGEAGLHALVNNAGQNLNGPYEHLDEAAARSLMEVNFFGLHRLSQACLPLLRQSAAQSGRTAKLIQIGSIGSKIGIPWEAFYHASKFALLGLSESIKTEVHGQGIRVSVVMPGGIRTPFIARTTAGSEVARAALSGPAAARYAAGMRRFDAVAGQVDRMGQPPEAVARRIAKLMAARNPPFRVLIGPDARIMDGLRRFLPERSFHALLRAAFTG